MAEHLDRIGQQIGEYRLLRWLGGGGFGNVYLAEQVRDHSQAAVKLLQIRLSRSEELKAFINEARTIRLKHPHIIPLLDFGISRQEIPFLVMEYAGQGTLRDRHPKGAQVPLTAVVSYVEQVASALLYAHEQRLIHRDVKPENMLLRADGTLLLSDFGIASVAHSSHSLSLHQGIGGTIPYMAPEQIQGQARAASDQYSLGVVAYEWIAGRRPFEGTAVEVAMQHAMKLPPSLTAQVPTLSRAVDQVVLKALAKGPGDRFVTVQDFAVALGQAVQGMPRIFSSDMPHRSLPSAMPEMHGASPIGSSEQVLSPTPSMSLPLSSSPNPPLVSPQVTSLHPSEPSLFPARTEIGSPGQSAFPLSPSAQIESSFVAGKPPQPIQRQPSQKSPHPVISASPVQMPMKSVLEMPSSSIPAQALNPSSPVFATQALAPRRTQRGNLPSWRVVVLAVLALMTISGGLFGYFSLRLHTDFSTTPQPTVNTAATAQTRATVQARITALAHMKPHLLWTFQTVPSDHSLLAVFNGVVYINSNTAMLYAIDATGHKKWSYTPTSVSINSSLTVANGVVYVGSDSVHFYAVDVATGQQQWDFSTNAYYQNSGVVANGTVYIHALGSPFYAVDATSGKQKWSLPTSGPSDSSNYTDPVVTNGVVYVGSTANGRLYAVDAVTGKQKWAFSLSAGLDNPIVSDGVVYIDDQNSGTFYAVDAVTGKQKWTLATKVNSYVLIGGVVSGMVYLGSFDGKKLYALDAATGKQKWTSSPSEGIYGQPIVSDGVIYSYCHSDKLCALDAATGKQKWTSSINGYSSSASIPPPIVSNGVVYIVDNSHLYAFDATTGQQGWTFSIGGQLGSLTPEPVLTDGVVYVGTEDGKISAISVAAGQQ